MHLKNDLVESTIFCLVQPQNLLILRTTKCLVDPTKYLIDSTKLFGCFNQIGLFGRFHQKIYCNQPKFVWFNQIFMDIQQNSFVGTRQIFVCVQEEVNSKTFIHWPSTFLFLSICFVNLVKLLEMQIILEMSINQCNWLLFQMRESCSFLGIEFEFLAKYFYYVRFFRKLILKATKRAISRIFTLLTSILSEDWLPISNSTLKNLWENTFIFQSVLFASQKCFHFHY